MRRFAASAGYAACGAFVALGTCGFSLAQQPLSRQSLLDLWETNCSTISDIEVRFTHSWATTAPGAIRDATFLFRWRETGQVYWDMGYGVDQGKTVSFDAVTREGRLRNKEGGLWRASRNYTAGGGTEWAIYSLRTPYPNENPYYAKLWDLSALLSHSESTVRADLEVINGSSVVVLDVYDLYDGEQGRLNMTVWLDPARNAVPLQWELFQDGSSTTTALLSDYERIGVAWYATNLQILHASGIHRGLTSEIQVPLDALGIRHIRPNIGLAYSDTIIQFAPNTPVVDEDTGELYLVQGPVNLPDALKRSYALGNKANDPSPSRSLVMWVALPVLGLASGVALGFVRRGRSAASAG